MENDLWGNPLPPDASRPILRKGGGYRGGYAAAPGSGPSGETCGSCRHYVSVQSGARRWPKCLLMKGAYRGKYWTRGPGSDIKKKAPACARWEAKLDAPFEP